MKKISFLILICLLFTLVGCETMKSGAHKGGEYIGKAADVGSGVTEGAVDGYMGPDEQENPYNR